MKKVVAEIESVSTSGSHAGPDGSLDSDDAGPLSKGLLDIMDEAVGMIGD